MILDQAIKLQEAKTRLNLIHAKYVDLLKTNPRIAKKKHLHTNITWLEFEYIKEMLYKKMKSIINVEKEIENLEMCIEECNRYLLSVKLLGK